MNIFPASHIRPYCFAECVLYPFRGILVFSLLQFFRKDRCKHPYILFIEIIDIGRLYPDRLFHLPHLHLRDLQGAFEYFADSLTFRLVIDKINIIGQLLNIYGNMHQNARLYCLGECLFQYNFQVIRNSAQAFNNHGVMHQFTKTYKARVTLSPAHQEKDLHDNFHFDGILHQRQYFAEKYIRQRSDLRPWCKTFEIAIHDLLIP